MRASIPSPRCLVLAAALALVALAPAASAQDPAGDVRLKSPAPDAAVRQSTPIRFTWQPLHEQSYFRLVFNRENSGWRRAPNASEEVRVPTLAASPRSLDLRPGRWYWRVCFGWDDDSAHACYFGSEVRKLRVIEELTVRRAQTVASGAVKRQADGQPRAMCRLTSLVSAVCTVRWTSAGRPESRTVDIRSLATGLVFRVSGS